MEAPTATDNGTTPPVDLATPPDMLAEQTAEPMRTISENEIPVGVLIPHLSPVAAEGVRAAIKALTAELATERAVRAERLEAAQRERAEDAETRLAELQRRLDQAELAAGIALDRLNERADAAPNAESE